MKGQNIRELELKEKEREEQRKSKEEKKEKPRAEAGAKKWKGKDWFVIFSPRMFGEKVIGETPATNPKTLIGRNIEVGISDLSDQQRRDFYRIVLMIERIDSRAAYTRFNGYRALKEHVLGMVRKRAQKVESVIYVKTMDDWKLQVSSVGILNRNTETAVKKKARAFMEKAMRESAEKSGIDDFVKSIISSNLQRGIKKSGSRIYPIRFFEVARIEVKGVPQGK